MEGGAERTHGGAVGILEAEAEGRGGAVGAEVAIEFVALVQGLAE